MLPSFLAHLGYPSPQRLVNRLTREDETTGLPLLANVYPELDRVLKSGRPIGLLYLHLVQFDVLKRLLPPEANMRLLQAVGHALKSALGRVLRAEDVVALGYGGGSDFMVFLTPARTPGPLLEDQLARIADRVRRHVLTQLEMAKPALGVQDAIEVRVGHTMIEPAQLSVQVLVQRHVEHASGRAQDPDWEAKRQLEQELLPILRERRIATVYQPIVSLVDGEVIGYEALTRGPLGSPLRAPDQLFGAADMLGLLDPLERLCVETAMTGARTLPKASRLFINISPEVAGKPSTAEYLLSLDSLPEARLVVEVTERQAIRDFDSFKRALGVYRAAGFGIAVDDAGAGHNSLHVVAALRPDFIKIDMSLVRDIDQDRAKYALVAALTTFADRIGAEVVAEGIETEAELNGLIEIGVHHGQGFLIAQPAAEFPRPASQLTQTIRKQIELREKQVTGQTVRIGDIAKAATSVEIDQPSLAAERLFRGNSSLEAIVVVEERRPIGLLSREKFFGKLGSQFGYAVFAARPVREALNSSALIVDAEESLDVVSHKAVHRRQEDAYDHIVVSQDGAVLGLISVIDLLGVTTQRQVSIAKYSNPLSGLPGNVLIQMETERRLQAAAPFVFCHVDLNQFKHYNDCCGFSAGDELILGLARTIQQAVHSTSDFVGHIGGDDFVVLTERERIVELGRGIVRELDVALPVMAGEAQSEVPRITVSLAAVTCRLGMSFHEVSQEAFKVKKLAKAHSGHAFVWDKFSIPLLAGLVEGRTGARASRHRSTNVVSRVEATG